MYLFLWVVRMVKSMNKDSFSDYEKFIGRYVTFTIKREPLKELPLEPDEEGVYVITTLKGSQ